MARKLTQKEQNDPVFSPLRSKAEVSRWERFTDFWSEFRWLVILGVAVLLIVVYTVFSLTSQVPDLTLCVVTTDTVPDGQLGPRLIAELTPYAMDMNADGKVLLAVEYCTIDSQNQEANEAFTQDVAGGKKFLILSSPEATQYLADHNLIEPMTSFTEKLPAGTIGVGIDELNIFVEDLQLHDDLTGWTLLMRSYSAEGLDKLKETKSEQISAFHSYALMLTEYTGEIPDTVS
ncbi:MAG TPA: hypothetical protein PK629_05150 [Oscillospiraceae bacterium]|nr:hypothetical protein [Oscillospiraceae bacterium]HPF56589.1 hypothetical protein [Clostridiales bacterium]HPK36497.1 hypothetical protein [Oscillospiraceae bacterium]HPR76443.1 hypothetical protein [Oscillospiraceae bacterium]